jgi:hypothetical protein
MTFRTSSICRWRKPSAAAQNAVRPGWLVEHKTGLVMMLHVDPEADAFIYD